MYKSILSSLSFYVFFFFNSENRLFCVRMKISVVYKSFSLKNFVTHKPTSIIIFLYRYVSLEFSHLGKNARRDKWETQIKHNTLNGQLNLWEHNSTTKNFPTSYFLFYSLCIFFNQSVCNLCVNCPKVHRMSSSFWGYFLWP